MIINFDMLYYQIQRYKFESNSQQNVTCLFLWSSCITRYKDTNLKAIHNTRGTEIHQAGLYYQIQRYKFESNSQQMIKHLLPPSRLYYQIQRYKFESNSQQILPIVKLNLRLYYQIQRYKFESNSQRFTERYCEYKCCITRYKDTNLKAIHNES